MSVTMDRPVTLPTADELDACDEALNKVNSVFCEFRWRIAYLGNVEDDSRPGRSEGDQVPTFEDIGRLYSKFIDFESSFDEARGYFNEMRRLGLRDLDHARISCDA